MICLKSNLFHRLFLVYTVCMTFTDIEQMWFTHGFVFFLLKTAFCLITAWVLTFIARQFVNRINRRFESQKTTNEYIYRTIRTVNYTLALFLIIQELSPLYNLANALLGATSIIAVAVGLAAQTTFGNYIAGFFLAVHQPFKVGDTIIIKDRNLSGKVKEMTFRHTVLETQEKTTLIVPNTVMNTVIVEDMSNDAYSELIELKVSWDTDLEALEALINKLLTELHMQKENEHTSLYVRGMGKDSLNAGFPLHARDLSEFARFRSRLLPALLRACRENNITLL